MKKLLLLLSLLIIPNLCYGAIGATCVWEIRTTATAGNLNGGGYTSGGTDYSQQDAAQLNLTDFATSGVGVTTLTTATGGFTSAMVGNIIHLTAGTNLLESWYEITAYTDTNTVTLDRAADDTIGAMSAATGYVGGALSLESTLDDEFFEQLSNGNIVYIEAGTYTQVENVAVAKDGTALNPITIEGYNASRGDNPLGDNRPFIIAGGYDFNFDQYWIMRNFRFTTTDSSGIQVDEYGIMENVKSHNTGTGDAISGSWRGLIIRCEAISDGGIGIDGRGYDTIISSYVHDSVTCIDDNYSSIIGNVIDTCTTGINMVSTDIGVTMGNTIYNCTTGISATDAHERKVINNLIDNCTTGITWTTPQLNNYFDYNLYSNTTADVVNITKGGHSVTSDITLTDAPNKDFTLPSGAGAIDAGLQVGTNQGAVGDYKVNIGADQDDVTAAGAGCTNAFGVIQ